MPLKTTSGRATHGVSLENSTLIAAHHRVCGRGKADELRWQAGRFYFVSNRRARRISQGEAVERFARFHTDEYSEGKAEQVALLLAPCAGDKARGVNREIERMSKGWTNGKRLRMAMVFESWAKHLRGAQ